MITSVAEGKDAIVTQWLSVWDAQGDGSFVQYDNMPDPDEGQTDAWLRFEIRYAESPQVAFGQSGQRRYTEMGFVRVGVYTPSGKAMDQADSLVQVCLNAFKGKYAGGGAIQFKNVRHQEIGNTDKGFLVNVIADFEYDVFV